MGRVPKHSRAFELRNALLQQFDRRVVHRDVGHVLEADADVERAAGKDLGDFFEAWLFGTVKPPLP